MIQELKDLCEGGSLMRDNYYSETYRASFILNNDPSPKEWDIQRIRIPFSTEKEKKLLARFHISEESLPDFYRVFRNEIAQHIAVSESLKNLNQQKGVDTSTVPIEKWAMSKGDENGNCEFFIITRPMDPLIGGNIISDQGALLSGILTTGICLLRFVKSCNEQGISLGTVDLDSVLTEESNGKTFTRNAFFLAAVAERKQKREFSEDLFTHMKPEIVTGSANPSYDGDIYSVCSILWTMLGGHHFTVAPDLGSLPEYCSTELTHALMTAMEKGTAGYRFLSRQLRKELNEIRKGEKEDTLIRFSPPPYLEAYSAIDVETQEEERTDPGPDKSTLSDSKKANIKRAIIIGTVLISALWAVIFPNLHHPEAQEAAEMPVPTALITPSPEPKMPATSRSVGLYTYQGKVVGATGSATSRFYLNGNGDIECDPQKVPTRLEELQFTDLVTDLREAEFPVDLSTPSVEISAADLLKYRIEEGRLLLPPCWDTEIHLRKVSDIFFSPTQDEIDRYRSLSGTASDPVSKPVADIRVEPFSSEEDLVRQYLEAMSSVTGVELNDEKHGDFLEKLTLEDITLTLKMTDSEWYEEYEGCDDHIYSLLGLLSRENECDRIRSRTSEVNGGPVTLYYDDAGNTYSEKEWDAQEKMRLDVEAAKKELGAYALTKEPFVLVPAEGLEEYVYAEKISMPDSPLSMSFSRVSSGGTGSVSFMVPISLDPEDTTCRTVSISISPGGGLTVPYRYNAEYIRGSHETYDDLTEFVLDYDKSENGQIILAFSGKAFGEYTVTAECDDGSANASLRILLEDAAPPSPSPSPTPTPAPTPKPISQQSYTGGYTPPIAPTPRPVSTPAPTAEPKVKEETTFSVAPSEAELKVGEAIDLKPSMSCTWFSSDPAVATIGGPQGRTVTGISVGTCEITARSGDGQITTIRILVER